jgi:hypothetical protein
VYLAAGRAAARLAFATCSCATSAQLSRSACELVALVLGVERVAEPAEQVAERLERAVGALLDRREHLHRAALDGVQAAAGGLAEVGGEQEQRAARPARRGPHGAVAPLVVHTEKPGGWKVQGSR